MFLHSYQYPLAAAVAVGAQIKLSSIQEVSTPNYIASYACANALLFIALRVIDEHGMGCIAARLVLINVVYNTVLIVLTGIRRLFFDPLSVFPGPRWAALTKLWEAKLNSDGSNAPTIRALHAKHGDVVRVGPHELSINKVEAIEAFYSRGSLRGPFYDTGTTAGGYNVINTRDNAKHREWRRIWDNALSSNALTEYSPRVEVHVAKFIELLEERCGEEVNATSMVSDLTFDIMTDLGFGIESGMQSGTGDPTYAEFLHGFMRIVAIFGSLRNLCELIPYLPEDSEAKAFKEKGLKMLNRRMALGKTRRDVFTYLLGEDEVTGTKFYPSELASNAQLMVVAGADTTSSAMANAFRELALHRDVQTKLQAEIDEVCSGGVPLNVANTTGLPYLKAVIDETLRLWPPLPTGAQALTGSNGVIVDGIYIPPRTCVRVHHLTIMRDERYFPCGDSFIPERWTNEKPELLKDRRAFIPFSYGPHNCVGKQLGLNELRLSIARVMEKFDISFGESYDEKAFLDGWKDYFAVKIGDLPLKFVPRK